MNHPAQSPNVIYWTDGDTDTPVFQRPKEFEQLLRLYKQAAPKKILEIGTYYGGTLKQWLQRAASGASVVSVDTYEKIDRRLHFPAWKLADCTLRMIKGNSSDTQVIEDVRNNAPYDWIFIDAGHYYHEVRNDWDMYSPMLAQGGYLILHDILEHPAHPEIEVSKLWREITTSESEWWAYIQDTTALWGGIGVVHR